MFFGLNRRQRERKVLRAINRVSQRALRESILRFPGTKKEHTGFEDVGFIQNYVGTSGEYGSVLGREGREKRRGGRGDGQNKEETARGLDARVSESTLDSTAGAGVAKCISCGALNSAARVCGGDAIAGATMGTRGRRTKVGNTVFYARIEAVERNVKFGTEKKSRARGTLPPPLPKRKFLIFEAPWRWVRETHPVYALRACTRSGSSLPLPRGKLWKGNACCAQAVMERALRCSDVTGPAQALKPSRAGPGLGQAEPSLTQGLGGLKARASEMPGPPGLESPGLDIYGQERADGAKRSRHFGLGGFGSVKCRTLCASNLLTHRIAVVSNVQNNRKTPNFVVGLGPSPGSGLQALHPGLGLGPEEFEARARPSRAQARAFRPSRARDITIERWSTGVGPKLGDEVMERRGRALRLGRLESAESGGWTRRVATYVAGLRADRKSLIRQLRESQAQKTESEFGEIQGQAEAASAFKFGVHLGVENTGTPGYTGLMIGYVSVIGRRCRTGMMMRHAVGPT
ncbi:hypothetical protein B0H16DRAFT_1459378 [Mycena metata]|uniref:Uncharacterized protein n=1 Tax=Mycena metata TaxID=1033252 RepID=A0AAD7IZ28_9AGAR|nr:hypothetical protein B0H16DRAFT_1459378 [Mycena metata]